MKKTILSLALCLVAGVAVAAEGLTESWLFSLNKGNLADATYFSSTAPQSRDMAYADGKLYVLNMGTPHSINIVDAATGLATDKTLSVEGIADGIYGIAGIKALGNTIIAAGMSGAAGTTTVWKWENDEAAPTKWFEISGENHGGVELGRSMNTSGDLTKGFIAFAGLKAAVEAQGTEGEEGYVPAQPAHNVVVYYTVTDGVVSETATIVKCGNGGGNASNQSVSVLPDGTLWLDNKDINPTHYAADGTAGLTLAHKTGKRFGAACKAFSHASKDYVAFTVMLGGPTQTSWGNGALVLADVTDEKAPVFIGGDVAYPAAGLGDTNWGAAIAANSVEYNITADGTIQLWVMVPLQGIAKYEYTPVADTTGLDNVATESVEVRKVVENGQVYIIRDGVKYNVLGGIVR